MRVGAATDPLEAEADREADRVMIGPPIQRKCDGCAEGEGSIQRRAAPGKSPAPAVVTRLGGGQALSPSLRSHFEPRFGRDFGGVRVHTGPEAAHASDHLAARAFTAGRDIAFAAGEYQPQTEAGRRLLAHELAHVVQQADGRGPRIIQRQERRPSLQLPPLRLDLSGSQLLAWEPLASSLPLLTMPTPGSSLGLGSAFAGPSSSSLFGIPPLSLRTPSLPSSPAPSSLLANPLGSTMSFSATPRLSLTPPFSTGATPPWMMTPPPSPVATSPSAAPLPSRLSLLSSGAFSFGGRINFPEAPTSEALAAAIRSADFMDQTLTGTFPSGWDAVDKGQFAQIVWSIVSTQLFPQLGASVSQTLASMPGSTPGTGLSYQLDLTLMTTPGVGGGASFQLLFP